MDQFNGKCSNFQKLNEELNDFHHQLKKKNFTDQEIQEIFSPILEKHEKSKRISLYIPLVVIVIFFAVKTSENLSENVWLYAMAFLRILLAKIHPFYDWTHLKNQDCLIPKWWEDQVSKNFTPNCNLCENVKYIDSFDYLTEEKLTNFYLDVQKPVILTGDVWPDVDELIASLKEDDFYATSVPCSLETNTMQTSGNIVTILRKASTFPSFFVHFQNCEYESMKYFRTLTPKPSFLPLSTSPVQYNWLLWTKNYTFPKYKSIALENSEELKVLGQIHGKLKYRLSPTEYCQKSCENLEIILSPNQFLIFTNFWNLEYQSFPNDSTDGVAAILEAHSIM
ncbi:hypothetical protein HHI36_021428 [Cryptolaemus montrouzieri]|uniref:Uncharacterized protein n=1 Tax=Cryptolaemus montrouzieri TaxID=559131 RepID=A0ABD2MXJ9_9CUCU